MSGRDSEGGELAAGACLSGPARVAASRLSARALVDQMRGKLKCPLPDPLAPLGRCEATLAEAVARGKGLTAAEARALQAETGECRAACRRLVDMQQSVAAQGLQLVQELEVACQRCR